MKLFLSKKRICKVFLVTLALVAAVVIITITAFGAQTVVRGRVTDDVDPNSLRARSTAGTSGDVLFRLSGGDEVIVLSEHEGEEVFSGNKTWYYIEYNNQKGYVYSHYIVIIPDATTSGESTTNPEDTTTPSDDTTLSDDTTGGDAPAIPDTADFEEYLNQQGFPESYKQALRDLHALYPNWIFKAQHLEYDFNEAVEKEKPLSLVSNGSISSWKSTEGDAYDWTTNTWRGYDGANWVRASEGIIAYYMDPRNFLGVNSVFLFLEQSYDGNIQTVEGVSKIIAGTFMENDVIDADGSNLNYATAIYNAGREYQANPYVLAAMIVQEQGSKGTSGLISGVYPGYEGYFNYFNIGAYSQGSMNAIQRGLWYAKGGNTGGTSNLRPWTTRLKAINGGAYYYASGYINQGQNTLYLKRFNVQGENPFTHQYMTNIQGAASEASELSQGYSQELRTASLSFYIPVYKNMPEKAVERPTGDGSPNMKLSSLSVENYELTPEFNPDVLEYMLVVPVHVNSIRVNAVAMEGSAVISGIGELALTEDKHVFEIKVTAGNGTVRIYKLTVAKEGVGDFGKVTFAENYGFKGTVIVGVAPSITVAEFRSKLLTEGNITVTSSAGVAKDDSSVIATGDKVRVLSTNNKVYGEYTVSVKGDITGDGKITITDLLKIRNHILGTNVLTELQFLSGDIDGGGAVNISDLLKIRNHILGTLYIS